ncbi:HprK-related kinase A [Sphingobium nicotianae]|uniref:HprK-related kinase A n=1 Tax=Sphingobium nicotianae TaxID=2782607 RepID=A0A9X1DEI8_9SPHN|nr:HprK-related kinase A [Sphingobium nicotianae]MBT2188088.1 HprK-related kinase A [Sphingobium nicotianae]
MRHEIGLGIGPATFRIGSAWRAPLDALARLYAAYPPVDLSRRVPDFTVRLQPTRPWRRLIRPSIFIAGDHWLPEAAPMALEHGLLAAEMGMNLQMALGWRRHVLLHASSVERDGKAIIITGESGSGKSTLAAMLGERGWRLMGDEFALLDPVSGAVFPFPRLISLKNQAIDIATAGIASERLGPLMAATAKGDIRHLVPRADAIARMKEPATPALLLFPQYGPAADRRPVDPGEAFVRLTQASTNYVALGEAGFRALTRFVTQVPAVALDYPDSATVFAAIDDLWSRIG